MTLRRRCVGAGQSDAEAQRVERAEQVRDATQDRTQRLLNRAVWDTTATMGHVRRFVAAGLDEAASRRRRRGLTVGALDETGQPKQGVVTCGVKRQYMGVRGPGRERDQHRAPVLRSGEAGARVDRRASVDPRRAHHRPAGLGPRCFRSDGPGCLGSSGRARWRRAGQQRT
ncbi:transposase [Micromonospora sp. WMMA1363]|uniref:transposase n=1 Tax=Micromonospora sp. WMMA1363 TaxID=3053985 RepID=UPI00338EB7CD